MNWSFRALQIAGIDIKIHFTFFLILVLGAIQWEVPYGIAGAIFGILLMILLFVCVTLHELGHSLVARMFGIPVREIILLPLGGVALLERNPTKAWHELLIAIAGPLVNLVIAAVLAAATGAATVFGSLDAAALQRDTGAPSFGGLLIWLLEANLLLALFNMIPAFPLDGGRVLRSILAMVTNFQRATRIATIVGQLIAVALGVFGIASGNFVLALVAVFVFLGAGQENAESQARTMLVTLRVGDAYNKHALTLEIGDRVSKVVDYILTSYQPDFAVIQGNRLLGIVTREDVMRALATDPRDQFVTVVMQRDIARVAPDMTLDQVRQVMTEKTTRVVAVYEGEQYLGLVNIDDIAEALAVITFKQRQQEAVA